ncbi:MAG: DUF1643 domain-containing protein [Geminocystis sp.]
MMKREERKAEFSNDRIYRYGLWRIWDINKPKVMFIGLNPSTANENENDKTIHKLYKYCQAQEYGGFIVGNLFAFVETDSKNLKNYIKEGKDIIGIDNDMWLKKLSNEVETIVAIWGNEGTLLKRNEQIIQHFPKLHCLKINKTGQPAHPLYLPDNLLFTPFYY